MLEVEVQKRFTGFDLDVAFRLDDELVALFGPSGAGKSVTLQCIAGLVKPDSGRIAINERPVFDSSRSLSLPPQRRRVGYVFQNYALFPHLSVEENIAYGISDLPRAERSRRLQEMVGMMRLDGLEKRRPHELSGGQRQRVALARALITEPDILLLDEPFAALDSAIRSRLQGELLELFSRLKMTIVLVTHNLAEAYTLSQRMIVYGDGRVLQVGHRDEIIRRPATRAVARFVGTKNIFRGTVRERGKDFLRIEGESFAVFTSLYPYKAGDEVEFCIRPEEIMLVRPGQEESLTIRENQVRGFITQEVAHGSSYTLLFRLDPGHCADDYDLQIELPTHVHNRLDLASQKEWTVSLKRNALHVLGPPEGKSHRSAAPVS